MKQDALQSAWQSLPQEKSNVPLKSMIRERHHPLMKRIRRQMIIEIAAITIFLFVYYDFFDGDQKPVYANLFLVLAIALAILNNVVGYRFTRFHPDGDNVVQLLRARIATMKTYAWVSVGSRILLAASLLLFFTSAIVLNATKYWILAGIVSVFIVQMVLLVRLWTGRISRLKKIYDSLME
jgi:hypothetical protein